MSLNYLKQVGNRLKKERKRLGYAKQADIAVALGLPERTYWDRESGNVAPDVELFARFRELGGDVMYVIAGEPIDGDLKTIAITCKQDRSGYLPADKAASQISALTLSENDAEMLVTFAKRLSSK